MERIARICWNTLNWARPSGPDGKSTSKATYENGYGIGHEEWLLDFDRIMDDGYHYGFLEGFNVKSDMYVGKKIDIYLYTISQWKTRLYVGCIRNVIGTNEEEQRRMFKYYKERGWIDEMKDDIRYWGYTPHDIEGKFLFNVKFRVEDADIIDDDKPILDPTCISNNRYKLLKKVGELKFLKDESGKQKTLNTEHIHRTNVAGDIIIDPTHKKIQNALLNVLQSKYCGLELEKEHIDLRGKEKATGEWHIFEVKTLNTAKGCIREAFGQIMEYAHYKQKTCPDKFIIVGDKQPRNEDMQYMDCIRKTYNIPIWYRWYNIAKDTLHAEV